MRTRQGAGRKEEKMSLFNGSTHAMRHILHLTINEGWQYPVHSFSFASVGLSTGRTVGLPIHI